jgi:hypothetical protein
MARRNDISRIVGFLLLLLCGVFCSVLSAAQTSKPIRKVKVVVQCGPDLDQAAARIFANPGLKIWKEYSKVEEVPPLDRDNGEQMFAVSLDSSGRKHVRLVEYNEDASISETYCYDQTGALLSLQYEIRTDWGWGYTEERLLGPTGGTARRTKRFFDTASNQTIPRPRQADDVPSFLEATIYPSFNELPFIELLKKPRVNAP